MTGTLNLISYLKVGPEDVEVKPNAKSKPEVIPKQKVAGSEDDESENSEEEKKAPAPAANEKEEKLEKKISLEKVENRSNAESRPGVSVSNSQYEEFAPFPNDGELEDGK